MNPGFTIKLYARRRHTFMNEWMNEDTHTENKYEEPKLYDITRICVCVFAAVAYTHPSSLCSNFKAGLDIIKFSSSEWLRKKKPPK